MTQQQVAIDDFKQYLVAELDTFKATVGRFAQAPSHRIGDIGAQVQALFAHARQQYNGIHSDFRHSVQDALQGFQQSVFTQYLEAELHVFKEAVGRFAKTQSDRVGDASVYVQTLFSRVQAHSEQLYDGQYNAQEMLATFRQSVKLHLEQFFGPLPLQMKGLD